MSRQIKLIWDFRGPDSEETAKHHSIHLKEYIVAKELTPDIAGFEVIDKTYTICFMVVTDETMIQVRDALKPHRAQVY